MSNPERGDPFLDEFIDDFYSECDEHLMSIRLTLLEAERQQGQIAAATVQDLFRSFHSIKGLAGMVGLRVAEALAHHMESYLRLLRDTAVNPTLEGVRALVRGTRGLELVLAEKQAGREPSDKADLLNELAQLGAASFTGTESVSLA